MERERAFSVSQINEYIKMTLESNPVLRDVWLRGEISNFKSNYSSGHLYFSLKDDRAAIRAVMFRFSAQKLKFRPESGMTVIVHGKVSTYPVSGDYQIIIDDMQPDGIGALYLAFEQLRKKLEAEGLFDQSRKRPLPKYPQRIGIITSPTGAAVRDMLQILGRRYPAAEVILYPALVQGEGAKESIVRGIRTLDRAGVDVMIVGRGGGSIEDLWAFNEEAVARAIFDCETPVISAVGHETDVTIADYAADLRAPTPSAAAELAAENIFDTIERLNAFERRLDMGMKRAVALARLKNEQYVRRLAAWRPDRLLMQYKNRLENRRNQLKNGMDGKLKDEKARLKLLCARLEDLSPLKRLSAGFSYVELPSGKSLQSVGQVNPGDTVTIQVRDGSVSAEVKEKNTAEPFGRQA